jgi:hypothetical protein
MQLANRLGRDTDDGWLSNDGLQLGQPNRAPIWQCLAACQAKNCQPVRIRDANDWNTVAEICQPDVLVWDESADDHVVQEIMEHMPGGGIVVAGRTSSQLDALAAANHLVIQRVPATPPRSNHKKHRLLRCKEPRYARELTEAALEAVRIKWELVTAGHSVSA